MNLYKHNYECFTLASRNKKVLDFYNSGRIEDACKLYGVNTLSDNDLTELKLSAYKAICDVSEFKRFKPSKLTLCHSDYYSATHIDELHQKLQDHDWLENTHDYIQWWFPLLEKSRSISSSPVLTPMDVDWKRLESFQVFTINALANGMKNFFIENDHWIAPYNHNHLRITRIIKSLRLLAGNRYANDWKKWLFEYLSERVSVIDPKAVEYWRDA